MYGLKPVHFTLKPNPTLSSAAAGEKGGATPLDDYRGFQFEPGRATAYISAPIWSKRPP